MRRRSRVAEPSLPAIGVLLEQSLGHVTHGRNLQRVFEEATRAEVHCRELPFESRSVLDRIPPRSNWTVRSGLAARRAVAELERQQALDALIVHTQVPAMLLTGSMRRIPTIVSLDATPKQIDELGGSYRHDVQADAVERFKARVHRDCFARAARLVTWSNWAANSLVDDYGIDRGMIEVIPPGAVASKWRRPTRRTATDSTVRVLFVGGDFERKGGETLLDAFSVLQRDPELGANGRSVELHVVTGSTVAERPGVHVYNGLVPNSPELIDLFHRCDVFALPTTGDCTPLVMAEAATAGLPTITTDVGAIKESVIDGETGHLVQPTVESVLAKLRPLVLDSEHRLRLGANAARHAAETMDADRNAQRLLDRAVELAEIKKQRPRVLLTVSGRLDPNVEQDIAAGDRPLADYVAISRATDAELLDWTGLDSQGSAVTRILQRTAGNSVAMGYHLWRRRDDYDVIITDGEQVGIPLAALSRLTPRRRHRHVMIGHRLSPAKKTIPIRLLNLAATVDTVLVYSSSQQQVAGRFFGDNVRLIDFMVDSEFFRAERRPFSELDGRRPLLCTAGRESRDYPCLIEAVRGMDVDLVVASDSPWSRRDDNAHDVTLPDNVTVTSLNQLELRRLVDRSDMVVVPLQSTDFQAGVTTILEAMSMERPVICTATPGQTDVVDDAVNGLYTPAGNVAAMREAIEYLLNDTAAAITMGKRGRELVERRADVRVYAQLFSDIVGAGRPAPSPVTPSTGGVAAYRSSFVTVAEPSGAITERSA